MSESDVRDGLESLSPPLCRALSAALGDRPVERVDRPTGSDRPGNEVLRVALAGGEPSTVYLKVATADRIAREAALARFVRANTGVRAPRVIAADAGADPPYLLTAPLAGERLLERVETADGEGRDGGDPESGDGNDRLDPDALAWGLSRVGRATARLHAARFETAGSVRGGDASGLDLDPAPWPALLRETVVEAHPVPDRFSALPERAGDLLRNRADALGLREPADAGESGDGPAPATVVHDDLHLQNVFDAGGDADANTDWGRGEPHLGVLDLESAMVGDPGFDLARTEDLCVDGRPELTDEEREETRAALRVGYRTGAVACGLGDDLPPGFERHRDTYRVVSFLLTAVTFERWAPAAPEPVDDLAGWVHEEFDRRMSLARGDGRAEGNR